MNKLLFYSGVPQGSVLGPLVFYYESTIKTLLILTKAVVLHENVSKATRNNHNLKKFLSICAIYFVY